MGGIANSCGIRAVMVASVVVASCARPVAPPVSTPPGDGAISWRVATGSLGGEQTQVCDSQAATPCVVPQSTPESPRTVAFSLFLHAGAVPVTYSGRVRVGFIDAEAQEGHELRLNDYRVDPQADPVGVAASGPVIRRAGTYTVDIALEARSAAGAVRTIARTVNVRVSGRTQ